MNAPSIVRPPRRCRFCEEPVSRSFIDLGVSPLCQTHIAEDQLSAAEQFYPLHAFVCDACFLVQLDEFVAPESIFSEYAYFSSYSTSWVEHAKRYSDEVTERFKLDNRSLVMEVASNDGYLLQHFVARGIPARGIEPAANVAEAAIQRGVPTDVCFLGSDTADALVERHGRANVVVGNNVFAHVPRLNDFVSGLAKLLAPGGVLTLEFPHLARLMDQTQFDTIYHEHFSYFSFLTAERVLGKQGLAVFDVQQLPTHGGSLRVFAGHGVSLPEAPSERVAQLQAAEREAGFETIARYQGFGAQVARVKRDLLEFLISAKRDQRRVVGYGAPGKGNTLLNYCGIRTDFLDFTVDANPYKQGKFTPGTRIPILHPDAIRRERPDFVLILPWNLRDEILGQAAYARDWGAKFVTAIPRLEIF